MKLRDFIARLEQVESANPGKDVDFETVETRIPQRITMHHYLVGIASDDLGDDASCMIQVSARQPQSITDEA